MTTITKLHLNGNDYDIGSEQNVKVFTLSSTSDLVNAQAAYDWWNSGGVPIVKYENMYFYYANKYTTAMYFSDNFHYNSNLTYMRSLCFTLSSGTVTAVSYLQRAFNVVTSLPGTPDANTIYFVTGS